MTPLAAAPKPAKLAALRARLGRLERGPAPPAAAFGPRAVPDPAACVTEILPQAYLDSPSAFAFLAALAAQAALLRPGPALLVICERGFDFGAPDPTSLAALGLPAERIVLVRAPDARSALWALEEGARAEGVAVAMAAAAPDGAYGLLSSRRLALATERTGVPVLVMRAVGAAAPSAARSRWRVAGAPSAPAPWLGATGLPGLTARRWRVAQARTPGAAPAFEVEWNETALRFDPPAALVRGPAAAGGVAPAIRAA